MQVGYKLATEALSPTQVVAQTRLAEQAGFDVEMSDHYHPSPSPATTRRSSRRRQPPGAAVGRPLHPRHRLRRAARRARRRPPLPGRAPAARDAARGPGDHPAALAGRPGWKVMSELPNPVDVEAASALITVDDVKQQFACGPDVGRHLGAAQQFVDAGFDHLVLQNAGPDPEGFLGLFAEELQAPLQALTPG